MVINRQVMNPDSSYVFYFGLIFIVGADHLHFKPLLYKLPGQIVRPDGPTFIRGSKILMDVEDFQLVGGINAIYLLFLNKYHFIATIP